MPGPVDVDSSALVAPVKTLSERSVATSRASLYITASLGPCIPKYAPSETTKFRVRGVCDLSGTNTCSECGRVDHAAHCAGRRCRKLPELRRARNATVAAHFVKTI